MKRMVRRILQCYGAEVRLVFADKEETVRAFLRPVTARGIERVRHAFDGLGRIPDGRYVFIGPADCGLAEARWAECGGRRFIPKQVETLVLRDEACYIWAVLQEGGAADDGALQ